MHLLIFGLGYTASRLAHRLSEDVWRITATRREATDDGVVAFESSSVTAAISSATHVLSSVPPVDGGDPVLTRYGALLAAAPARWVGYLSSTGVYGDAGGAWVDEASPVGGGRRTARVAADRDWQAIAQARVFRLPGIYGPGRSAIDRVRDGTAQRIDAPDHFFSRIHVDDIVAAVIASFGQGGPGVYNLADETPAPGAEVIDHACDLLGRPHLPLIPVDAPSISPMSRGFYAESRRVSASKARRELGVRLIYPDYRSGLLACL